MRETTTLVPAPSDAELALAALHELGPNQPDRELHLRAHDSGADIVVPPALRSLIFAALDSFARGEGVSVVSADVELTTQQAADLMQVSRPYLVKLLDQGEIAHRTVGRNRRVRASALMSYMRREDARRSAAADELSREAFELGLT